MEINVHGVGYVEDSHTDMSNTSVVDRSQDGMLRHDADVIDCSSEVRDATGDNSDRGESSQSSWLYQCMISECSATFQRLTDLRVHFMASHQSGSYVSYLCVEILNIHSVFCSSFLHTLPIHYHIVHEFQYLKQLIVICFNSDFYSHIYILLQCFGLVTGWVSGLFAPRYFHSSERKFPVGTFAPRNESSRELSLLRTNVPWNFRSRERMFP